MPDQSTGVCAARTNALVCSIHELIAELEERIEDGEPFDNPETNTNRRSTIWRHSRPRQIHAARCLRRRRNRRQQLPVRETRAQS